MRVLVGGATGFVGRALIPALRRDGHEVVVWARSETRARNKLGAEVHVVPEQPGDAGLVAALDECDAVINLAGSSILGGRWTKARRREMVSSRVDTTRRLVAALRRAAPRDRVFLSTSAVGYYGDRGAEPLSESSAPGRDFLADLCVRWEAAARAAANDRTRVVCLRLGVVIGREGGALAQMLPVFRLGLGGRLGSGNQFFPWIHLHDLVDVFTRALTQPDVDGIFNVVAPDIITNRVFTQALATALRRPAVLPVPAWVLRLVFGGGATALLGSQRLAPFRLAAHGFPFAFPTITEALHDVLDVSPVRIRTLTRPPAAAAGPNGGYLRERPARYELRTRTVLDVPVHEAFPFFASARNLGLITPDTMAFAIEGEAPDMAVDARIAYRIRIGPSRLRWQTRIAQWDPGTCFVDVQESGPYRSWWHEHTFRAEGGRTVMEDAVYYAPPFGALGALAHRLVIADMLRRIFSYRGDVIRLRFGHATV